MVTGWGVASCDGSPAGYGYKWLGYTPTPYQAAQIANLGGGDLEPVVVFTVTPAPGSPSEARTLYATLSTGHARALYISRLGAINVAADLFVYDNLGGNLISLVPCAEAPTGTCENDALELFCQNELTAGDFSAAIEAPGPAGYRTYWVRVPMLYGSADLILTNPDPANPATITEFADCTESQVVGSATNDGSYVGYYATNSGPAEVTKTIRISVPIAAVYPQLYIARYEVDEFYAGSRPCLPIQSGEGQWWDMETLSLHRSAANDDPFDCPLTSENSSDEPKNHWFSFEVEPNTTMVVEALGGRVPMGMRVYNAAGEYCCGESCGEDQSLLIENPGNTPLEFLLLVSAQSGLIHWQTQY